MNRSNRSLRIITFFLSISLLTLAEGVVQPAGAESAINIQVEPNVIDTKAKKININGSGFTPGTQVTVGFPDVPVHKDLPFAKGMWFSVVTVNQSGAFLAEVELRSTLWRLSRVVGKKKIPGSYRVVAKNLLGETAAATLMVQQAKAEKK